MSSVDLVVAEDFDEKHRKRSSSSSSSSSRKYRSRDRLVTFVAIVIVLLFGLVGAFAYVAFAPTPDSASSAPAPRKRAVLKKIGTERINFDTKLSQSTTASPAQFIHPLDGAVNQKLKRRRRRKSSSYSQQQQGMTPCATLHVDSGKRCTKSCSYVTPTTTTTAAAAVITSASRDNSSSSSAETATPPPPPKRRLDNSPIAVETEDFPCFSGCRCPAPECVVVDLRKLSNGSLSSSSSSLSSSSSSSSSSFACVESPYFISSIADEAGKEENNDQDEDELICTHGERGDAVPPFFPSQYSLSKFSRSDLLPILQNPNESARSDIIRTGSGYRASPAAIEVARAQLRRFKRATSWAFKRWFDWGDGVPYGGEKKNFKKKEKQQQQQQQHQHQQNQQQKTHNNIPRFVAPPDAGHMSGGHDPHDGVYRWRNVCLRSEGTPLGYEPNADRFRGVTEVDMLARAMSRFTRQWIATVLPLEAPPPVVLDMRVMLMPVDWKADNPGHVFYRHVAAKRIADAVFGGEDDFHVIYVANPRADTRSRLMQGHKWFYQLLSKSWASIYTTAPTLGERTDHAAASSFSSAPSARQMMKELSSLTSEGEPLIRLSKEHFPHRNTLAASAPYVCFKEVVIAHVCDSGCNLATLPGNRYQYPYIGLHRASDALVIHRVRQQVEKCLFSSEKQSRMRYRNDSSSFASSNSSSRPVVVTLIARTKSRVDFGLASAVPAIDDALSKISSSFSSQRHDHRHHHHHRLQVVSQADLTPREFFISLMDSDVLLGTMGASLTFSWLMPPASVVVEITGVKSCAYGKVGWDLAPDCDFGGNSDSNRMRHLIITLPKASVVGAWGGGSIGGVAVSDPLVPSNAVLSNQNIMMVNAAPAAAASGGGGVSSAPAFSAGGEKQVPFLPIYGTFVGRPLFEVLAQAAYCCTLLNSSSSSSCSSMAFAGSSLSSASIMKRCESAVKMVSSAATLPFSSWFWGVDS